ncbi:MAG: OB-fold domain-containing protein [Candidatus Omnitrophica bacterium]|nr:OB-fold domain-containing protein [Candidatus Omnitrophota bacterium]
MISSIRGKLIKKEDDRLIVEVGGISYEIAIPRNVSTTLKENNGEVELVIYHYFNIDGNRGIPVLIGFSEELERDFFEKFISVSGVGPKGALRAFDKPISRIARAIEEGDVEYLTTLVGIGKQKAKQIVAYLQGKVGRFALIKEDEVKEEPIKKEIVEEARQILRRLQYGGKEMEDMLKKALAAQPHVDNVEDLLNEIYRQRR